MNEKIKAFWLGLFIIGAIVIAVWLILFLRPSLGDGKKTLKVRFANIQNVTPGTRVTFAGKPVGEVFAIHEIYNARDLPKDLDGNIYFYELVLHLDSKVKVFSSDEIVFATTGLLGEKSIEIIPKASSIGPFCPHEIKKDEPLYARSSDQMQDAIQKIGKVADSLNDFFDRNEEKMDKVLDSLACATHEVCHFFGKANESDFVTKVGDAFACIGQTCNNVDRFAHWLSSPQGTLGRLVESDNIYLKLSSTLSRFEMTLSDINRYGLLFQFDKKWQRERRIRECRLQELSCGNDLYQYFNAELSSISDSMYKISCFLDRMKRENIEIEGALFSPKFTQLLNQIQELERSLNGYNPIFMECP